MAVSKGVPFELFSRFVTQPLMINTIAKIASDNNLYFIQGLPLYVN